MTITPAVLQSTYLNGLVLADPKGRPMTDDAIQAHIKSAEAAFRRRYSLCLTPTRVRLGAAPLPGDAPLSEGMPTMQRDAPPYVPRAFHESRHASIRLPIGPVREVHAVGLKLPGQQQVTPFPPDWIQVDHRNRVVQLYPGGNSLVPTAFTATGMFALTSGRTIPAAWQVSYTAGYTAEELADEYADVAHALGSLAALNVLIPGSVDRFTASGVTGLSASVDGLSQNTQLSQNGNTLKYGALMNALKDDVEAWDRQFRARQGIMVSFA